jgi:hypothetical protein
MHYNANFDSIGTAGEVIHRVRMYSIYPVLVLYLLLEYEVASLQSEGLKSIGIPV